MSWCCAVCDAVESAAEWIADSARSIVDGIVDAVETVLDAVTGALAPAVDWLSELVQDSAEFVGDVAAQIWDAITTAGGKVWDFIKAAAGSAWEWTSACLADAWEWARDSPLGKWVARAYTSIGDALVWLSGLRWEYLSEAVFPVFKWFDPRWILGFLDDALFGALLGLACVVNGAESSEYGMLEALYRLDDSALRDRAIAFLPEDGRYVVTSDHHLFVAGDVLDKFREMGNHELYQIMLQRYAAEGYTLIENGDVEDLWMRETSHSAAVIDEALDVLGWPVGDALDDAYEDARVRAQAVKIFDNNADVYQTIRELFHEKGRYVRVAGNHDDYWRRPEFVSGLQLVYPDIEVFDYAFIGPYGTDRRVHGGKSPRTIVMHGHQIDPWNNARCSAAGAALTAAASGIAILSAGVKDRTVWERELVGSGFENVLSESKIVNEVELQAEFSDAFSNTPETPQIVLGHTHESRHHALDPHGGFGHVPEFDAYTNDGTAGRWEQFVWAATVVAGKVELHGWFLTRDGALRHLRFARSTPGRLQAA